jgi:hypothetical protein
MADINIILPAGSNYFIEVGHNGNGNIEVSSKWFLVCHVTYLTQDAAPTTLESCVE